MFSFTSLLSPPTLCLYYFYSLNFLIFIPYSLSFSCCMFCVSPLFYLPGSFLCLSLSLPSLQLCLCDIASYQLLLVCFLFVSYLRQCFFTSRNSTKKLFLEEQKQRTLAALLRALMPLLQVVQLHSVIRHVGNFEPQTSRLIGIRVLVYALNVRLGWVDLTVSMDV